HLRALGDGAHGKVGVAGFADQIARGADDAQAALGLGLFAPSNSYDRRCRRRQSNLWSAAAAESMTRSYYRAVGIGATAGTCGCPSQAPLNADFPVVFAAGAGSLVFLFHGVEGFALRAKVAEQERGD